MTCGATPQLHVPPTCTCTFLWGECGTSNVPEYLTSYLHSPTTLPKITQGICTTNISARGIYFRSIYAHLSWETERTIRCMYSTRTKGDILDGFECQERRVSSTRYSTKAKEHNHACCRARSLWCRRADAYEEASFIARCSVLSMILGMNELYLEMVI